MENMAEWHNDSKTINIQPFLFLYISSHIYNTLNHHQHNILTI